MDSFKARRFDMSDVLSNTLSGFGVFALVAAIVGGGLKAFGFELGPLKSTLRQIILAGAGMGFILLANWQVIQQFFSPVRFLNETRGPTTLQPGEVHSIPFSLSRSGPVEVVIQTLVPDWSSFSGQPGRPGQAELFVTICAAASAGPCPSGQVGVLQPFSQELPSGSGSIRLFNFATSPRVTFTISIKHPA
ncbi:hypothetical protein DF3PB_5500003 [uncultured Defluviicoccus sp.]|uniref:Uncharacterized protein n=1 Tax=metagenome TaxID=256318 RepID=A0A380TI63_9ZZZZ|nr:hypothetical protein DF3PB_5500003 [uncultured Defluviicoccus sp.]